VQALFPLKVPISKNSGTTDLPERFALSLGLNFILLSVTGLALNYTPFGIRATPVLTVLLGTTLVFATIAIFRQCNAPKNIIETSSEKIVESEIQ
jgi:uncharacterized membrane protein